MSLWRLEWLRLTRTRRVVALGAVFVVFGALAAPMTRYLGELLANQTGSIQIIAPPPVPADAVANYVSNAAQIGLLVYALVAASALAVDAHRETAVFLRTRVRRSADLVVPRYVVVTVAGTVSFAAGALVCWWGTVALIGSLPAAGMVAGTVLGCLYLAFLGSLTALFSARLSSVVGPTAATLGVALGLALLGSLGTVGDWLPSHLVGSLHALAAGGDVGGFARSAAVTVAATLAALAGAVRLAGSREI